MSVPSAVNIDSQDPDVVNISQRDNASSASSSPSSSRPPPNFSRPLPLSPAARAPVNVAIPPPASSNSNISRPLPSIPGAMHDSRRQSLDHAHGGRGSGLGVRIIDDRDPDDLGTSLAPPHSHTPVYGFDDDGQTSSAASVSEALYASARSTPLRAPVDLGQGSGDLPASTSQNTYEPHRRATVAVGETRRDHREGSLTPKRAVTVDTHGGPLRAPDMPVPQVPDHPQIPQQNEVDDDLDALEYSDDIDPYLRKLVENYNDEPRLPGSFIQDEDGSPTILPTPKSSPPHIVLGLPVAESHSQPSPQSDNETVTMSMPSFVSFPIPLHAQRDSAWKSYASSSLHGALGLGDQEEKTAASKSSLDSPSFVITGTNLEFEPLPSPHEGAAFGPSYLPHTEGKGHVQPLSNPPTLSPVPNPSHTHTHRPLPSFPTPSPQTVQGGSRNAGTFNEGHFESPSFMKPEPSGASMTTTTDIPPVAPLRIHKHLQTPSSTAALPPGAAQPTPPTYTSPPDLQKRLGQDTSISSSASPKTNALASRDVQLPHPHGKVTATAVGALEPSGNPNITPSERDLLPAVENKPPTLPQGITSGDTSTLPHSPPRLLGPVTKNTSISNGAPHIQGHASGAGALPQVSHVGKERDAHLISSDEVHPASEKPVEPRLRRQSGPRARIPLRPGTQPQDAALGSQSNPESQDRQPQAQPRSQLQTLKPDSGTHSPSPPLPPPKSRTLPPPQRTQPHTPSILNSSGAPSVARKRISQADVPLHQPQTLAEEKAQYNAIPPSSRSQYMQMLLALDDIPMTSNLLASFFTWILLAGFILFPGTFTSLRTLNLGNGLGAAFIDRIVNLPLFVVAFICTGIGVVGMGYLWWKWMKNYIWLVNKIFLPGFMNSLAGIISTLANVYGVQDGEFNKSSIITISVTGGVGAVSGLLVLIYGVWMLGRVKKRHQKEIGIERAGKHGEGVWSGFKDRMSKVGKRK